MAVDRGGRPYSAFNFLVQIDGGPDARGDWRAGFQEVTGLGMEITVAEYRAGSFKDNTPMKVTGTYKVPDVTLKRGVVGDLNTLYAWLNAVRNGQQDQLKEVTIMLLDEQRSDTPVQSWRLKGARPTKYTGPNLSGKSTDVAIEELVLACERIDLE